MGQAISSKGIKQRCAAAFADAGMKSFDDLHAKVPFMPLQTLKALFEGRKSPIKPDSMEFTQEALQFATALKSEPGVLFFPPIPEGPKGPRGETREPVNTYDRIIKLWLEGNTATDIAAKFKCKVTSVELNFRAAVAKFFPEDFVETEAPTSQSDEDYKRKFDIFLRTGKAASLNTFSNKWKKLSRTSQMAPLAFANALTYISRHTAVHVGKWEIPTKLFLQTTEADDKIRRDMTVGDLEKILGAVLDNLERLSVWTFEKAGSVEKSKIV